MPKITIQAKKGIDGKTPSKEELESIIVPLIPSPIKGEDGKSIKGDTGEKGLDGINGVDGKDGKDGDKGDKGERGEKGQKGDKGEDGKDVDEKIISDIQSKVNRALDISSRDYDLKELKDVSPSIANATNGQVLKKNSTTGLWEAGNDTGSTSFITLTDTPNSYSGQAGKYPVVNGTETGLEFGTITPPSTPSLQEVTDVGATTTNTTTFSPSGNNKAIIANGSGSGIGIDITHTGSGTKLNIGAGGSGDAIRFDTDKFVVNDDGDISSSLFTASTILSADANKEIKSLSTATYPSLTELSYVKGVTSAIQAQLNAKQATLVSGTNIKTINGSSVLGSGDLSITGTMAIGGTITSATAGSVLFAGASGVLQQDNANFFWDDTNNRLGLGKNNPSYTLDLMSSGNIQARIGTQGSSFGYTIGRNTSTGFLDILGNQTPFSGINVDKITSAGAITIGGNAVISNWSSSLGIGNGSGSPISTIDIRSASNSVPNLSMGGGVSSNYNFRRNTTTGYLEITGVQGGFTGYKFSTGNYTDIFTLIDGVGAVFNEGGEGAIDFRVESDTDANNFFVDASANANGFGTNAPSAKVHIVKTTLQQRIGYDASNYFDTLVGSTGGVTFDAVGSGAGFTFSDPVTVNGLLTLSAQNIATDTTTGMKIGTGTTQKLGFWNTTPDVQPTTAITASAFVANTSLIFDDSATYGGYTMGQVVASLKRAGLLA